MELKRDYLLGYEIIVSPERAKRPHQFNEKEDNLINIDEEIKKCPFCPGNEDKTPNEYFSFKNEKGEWFVRVFPNKFKVWDLHDVIVDTRDHLKDWDEIDVFYSLKAIQKRLIEIYSKEKNVKWVSVFRNYGKEGGASIRHSHLQLIGLNFIPKKIEELGFKLKKCNCFICNEKWKKELLIKETENFRVLLIDGRFAYEFEIHPKEHKPSLIEFNDEELRELAEILKKIVKIFKEHFNNYNVLFFNKPKNTDFHFFIRAFPRINKWAGFELESSIIVNPLGKEKAFEFLKEKIEKEFKD
jgi:UDPglucose--hexose-1-phosphate uridylyltransferase